jgi:hypothetical protein
MFCHRGAGKLEVADAAAWASRLPAQIAEAAPKQKEASLNATHYMPIRPGGSVERFLLRTLCST